MDKAIGRIIYNRRKELGLTLEDVAHEVDVGRSTVSKWERGVIKNMGCDKVILLANVLKTSPSVILGVEKAEGGNQINIVRCKYCVFSGEPYYDTLKCRKDHKVHREGWFCADGERREE